MISRAKLNPILGASALVTLCLALPSTASAYVGPGAGLTVIGSLVAVVAAVLIALVGLVLFPLRLLMKKMRADKAASSEDKA
jgi:hypothetical protein